MKKRNLGMLSLNMDSVLSAQIKQRLKSSQSVSQSHALNSTLIVLVSLYQQRILNNVSKMILLQKKLQ